MEQSTKSALIGGAIGTSGTILLGVIGLIFWAGGIAREVGDHDREINNEIKPGLALVTGRVSEIDPTVRYLKEEIDGLLTDRARQQLSELRHKAVPDIPGGLGVVKGLGTIEQFDPKTWTATIKGEDGKPHTYKVSHDAQTFVCPPSQQNCKPSGESPELAPGAPVAFRYAPSHGWIDMIYTATPARGGEMPPAPK